MVGYLGLSVCVLKSLFLMGTSFLEDKSLNTQCFTDPLKQINIAFYCASVKRNIHMDNKQLAIYLLWRVKFLSCLLDFSILALTFPLEMMIRPTFTYWNIESFLMFSFSSNLNHTFKYYNMVKRYINTKECPSEGLKYEHEMSSGSNFFL